MINFPFYNYNSGTELISNSVLIHTENAVFTDDGRYFVAGKQSNSDLNWGIYEVVKTSSSYDIKQIVPGILKVDSNSYDCWFHGLTTDGKYLYATSAVHLEGDPQKTDYGALFRILPHQDTANVSIAHYNHNELRGYNGMAVGANEAIYMSNSSALRDSSKVAVYKVEIIDHDDFVIKITPWLSADLLRDIAPNGIQIQNSMMYYVSGKGLYKLQITPSGPGIPIPMYVTMIFNNILDDLAILSDDRIAVAEIDFISAMNGFPGIGINQIIIVDTKNFSLNNKVIVTSPYTVSSLAEGKGNLFTNGNLIATSWFQGGVREFAIR